MAANAAIWGAPTRTGDLPASVPMMLRTGRLGPGMLPWPENDPRRMMIAGGDSAELAEARGETPELLAGGNREPGGLPVPGVGEGEETPGQQNGFWQSAWGQGAGILGASVLTNQVFGDRSLRGTAQNAIMFSAVALPVMNAENGGQRMLNGMGQIFRGIQQGHETGDWSQMQAGFGSIGGVYSEGIQNLTGLDLNQAFGANGPNAGPRGVEMPGLGAGEGGELSSLGQQVIDRHLGQPGGTTPATDGPRLPRLHS